MPTLGTSFRISKFFGSSPAGGTGQPTVSFVSPKQRARRFVTRLNPTKLVFHNLLADGLLVSPLSDWRPSRLDEAVHYIFDNVPTLHDRKRSTVLPYVILYCFPGISRVRIVFSPWEINCVDEHEEPCNDQWANAGRQGHRTLPGDVRPGGLPVPDILYGLDRVWLEQDEDSDQWTFDCCGGTLEHRVREALARLTRVDGDGGETAFDGNITFYSWDQWLKADKYGRVGRVGRSVLDAVRWELG
ncbi:hypothetical protein JCM24511_08220 [Saitozyma sp. JCM 24511]|nr:hypothetical protein JCM24511_08220 [Saitozyma sp. JCM 24511]